VVDNPVDHPAGERGELNDGPTPTDDAVAGLVG
jgi:hypothetical protein